MLLSEPPTSPYDWHFSIFGFPVRVTWSFWLIAAVWGYERAYYMDRQYYHENLNTPGMYVLLAIWIGSMLLSILVHELGHTFAFRYYGIESTIVLYHMGGLAIPSGYGVWSRQGRHRLDAKAQIVISAAGPAAQILLAILVGLIAWSVGLHLGSMEDWLEWMGVNLPGNRNPSANASLDALVEFLIYYSVIWAVLNLIPILPLDGGNIARYAIGLFRGTSGTYEATVLSVICGIGGGLYFLQSGQSFMGIFFLILGISNAQALQGPRGI